MRIVWSILFVWSVFIVWLFLYLPGHARDLDGHYAQANPQMHEWFKSLHSTGSMVPCCDIADGKRVDDVDWQTKDGHYQVRLEGKWIDVPDDAVVTAPNKFGPAVVWPFSYGEGDIHIRCFMPGSGA